MLPLERYLVGRGRLYVCAYLLKKAQQHFCVSVEYKYLRLTQWCVAGRLWRRRSRRTLAPGLILFISLRLRSTSSAKSPFGNSLWVELHFFFSSGSFLVIFIGGENALKDFSGRFWEQCVPALLPLHCPLDVGRVPFLVYYIWSWAWELLEWGGGGRHCILFAIPMPRIIPGRS